MKYVIRKEDKDYAWTPADSYDDIESMPDDVAKGVALLDAAASATFGRYKLEGVGVRLREIDDDTCHYYLDIHAYGGIRRRNY